MQLSLNLYHLMMKTGNDCCFDGEIIDFNRFGHNFF